MRPARGGSSARILALGAILVLTASAGLSTRLYGGPGSWLVRGSVGGFFYVLFWCFLGYLLFPGARPGAVALTVLAATCAIEFSQLRHPPFLEAARGTLTGGLLLGSVFSWADFPWYFAGCGAAWLAGRTLQS
ncbi:MAG: DUF2809 domain-containing protein [Chlamydiota bacterium]